jgi:hypothetical protein
MFAMGAMEQNAGWNLQGTAVRPALAPGFAPPHNSMLFCARDDKPTPRGIKRVRPRGIMTFFITRDISDTS